MSILVILMLRKTVLNYLREAGIDTNGVTVNFTYLNGDTDKTHPYEAIKRQRFRVDVSLPFQNVNWTLLRLTNVQTLTARVDAESLVDDPFTIDTSIPNGNFPRNREIQVMKISKNTLCKPTRRGTTTVEVAVVASLTLLVDVRHLLNMLATPICWK